MSDKYTIARLTKDNEHFEILVKPDKALDYRTGKTSRITEVLAAEIIFADANKGTKVSEENMNKAFATTDPLKIADEILHVLAPFDRLDRHVEVATVLCEKRCQLRGVEGSRQQIRAVVHGDAEGHTGGGPAHGCRASGSDTRSSHVARQYA